ncbi:MAG: patatin-like phospholipase family protein [Bacteroidales bacterium]|nr:patatin-like phospholipase family protein [Bacteroidales bacterium]
MNAYCQDTTSVITRPKVGLVLSGGGAKGAAHIGVLKYIEEVGIPIDYVAGTSMGSIIGGMYALGYSSEEILNIISDVDWDRLISDQVDRQKISYERKSESRSQLVTVPFSMGTDKQEMQSRSFKNSLPTGIVSGDNLINLFNSLSVGYSDPIDFNDLPTPFLCIATNVINGEADVLNKGVFSKSLRASMAIPILFDPVKIDDTLYADGGLVNNFPAEQCRAMGADFIIGVSMSPGLESDPEQLSSLFSQVKQLKEIITDKEFENYHKKCDIFISPDLKGVGMLSFDSESVARITESGYEAASMQADHFNALKEKISSASTPQSAGKHTAKKAVNLLRERVLISGIEMDGVENDIENWMRRRCSVKVGDSVCKDDIDKSVSLYYGTGNYSSITYTLHEDPASDNAYILKFKFVENPPHDLGLGFRFDSQDMLSVLLHMGINKNHMSGFKADLSAKLGSNQWLNTNLSYGHMLYPRINLGYNFRNSELDTYDMDELVMNMHFLQHKFRLYLSQNYSRTISIGAGLDAEILSPRKVMYLSYDTVDKDIKFVNTLGSFAYLHYDNLNKASFATRGVTGKIDFNWKDMIFSSNATAPLGYGSVVMGFEGYVPIVEDRLVLIPQLYGSFLFGKGSINGTSDSWNPVFDGPVPAYPAMNNIIGGAEMGRCIDQQLPFIGVNKVSLAFNNVAVVRTDVRTRLFNNHYLTGIVNYARSSVDFNNFFKESTELQWPELYDYNASNWWGAGVRYSIDTKSGPLSFDVTSSNISKTVNLYFSLGYYF